MIVRRCVFCGEEFWVGLGFGCIEKYYEHKSNCRVAYRATIEAQLDLPPNGGKNANSKGLKYDDTKIPLSLLSRQWLDGVGQVLAFGAKKYAAHNWRGGIQASRLLSAALRHIMAYNDGEDLDQETGLSHLHHASCCLMFLSELQVTHPEMDDRYKREKSK